MSLAAGGLHYLAPSVRGADGALESGSSRAAGSSVSVESAEAYGPENERLPGAAEVELESGSAARASAN